MEVNDFLGSFAQENVSFRTQIVRTSSFGDNFWTPMIFVEQDRFVDATAEVWEEAPGLSTCKVLVVNADTYAAYTSGLLKAWLYDLFVSGFTGNCILAAPATKVTTPAANDAFVTAMNAAYDVLKPYGYHKTVCAGGDAAISPLYAVALATKCAEDEFLSGAPLFPCTNATPASDPIYTALHTAGKDAFLAYQADSTRNAALFAVGQALSIYNGSKTPVGNSLDMISTQNITASGADGANPSDGTKTLMKNAHIQYYKTVGNNSSAVAGEGGATINDKVYAAYWILAYITYMTKVKVAGLLTSGNFRKNASNYDSIVAILSTQLSAFAGMLEDIVISAPAYEDLPEASSDSLVIPNAWSARYVDQLHNVTITGMLYIGV